MTLPENKLFADSVHSPHFHGVAGQKAYAPAAFVRENDFEIAASAGPLNLYGVTAPDALAAPGEILIRRLYSVAADTRNVWWPRK